MPEIRRVLVILAHSDPTVPSVADFRAAFAGPETVQEFWQQNAVGVVQLAAYDLVGPFPVSLPALSVAYGPEAPRWDTVGAAMDAARDAGVAVDSYDTFMTVLHPGTVTTMSGQVLPYDLGANGNRCLVAPGSTGTYVAHELGHALGFTHSLGYGNLGNGTASGSLWYGHPYDLMSGETFGNAQPVTRFATARTGYPRANSVGPMLARASLYSDKPAATDEAGLTRHVTENGTTSVSVFAAGTGGPGRPELIVYRTSGGAEILVEYRRGADGGSQWDRGLERGVDDQLDAPGIVVTERKKVVDAPVTRCHYRTRLALPGFAVDAAFDTVDGRFTLRVQDPQVPRHDEVVVSLRRGTPPPSVMVQEDSSDTTVTVSSEMRFHPRYPDRTFSWRVVETLRHLVCTPRVVGVGVGQPSPDGAELFTARLAWWIGDTPLTAPGGAGSGVTWTLDADSQVLSLHPATGGPALSLDVRVEATDLNLDPGTPAASTTVRYESPGRREGWGPDFLAFISSRLGELVVQEVPVVPRQRPDVDGHLAELEHTLTELRTLRPDLARGFEAAVSTRRTELQAKQRLLLDLRRQLPDLTFDRPLHL